MTVNLTSIDLDQHVWDQRDILEKGLPFLKLAADKLDLQHNSWRETDKTTLNGDCSRIIEATKKCMKEIEALNSAADFALQRAQEKETSNLFENKDVQILRKKEIEQLANISKVSRAALNHSQALLKYFDSDRSKCAANWLFEKGFEVFICSIALAGVVQGVNKMIYPIPETVTNLTNGFPFWGVGPVFIPLSCISSWKITQNIENLQTTMKTAEEFFKQYTNAIKN